MGSQFVDGSPSMGSILGNLVSGFESAPGKALSNIHAAETIKDQRIKRQREQELYDLNVEARNRLDPAIAPAQATPTTTVGPFVGDINDSAVTTGLPTVSFIDPRQQAAAEASRALAVAGGKASIAKDPTNWSSQLAQGNVASAGMPQTAQGRAESEFLVTGKWPSHIGRDESKNPIKNWNEINPETNQPTGRQVSAATQPGPNYVLGSPRGLTPDNPIESVPIAQNNFNQLAIKLHDKISQGIMPDPAEIQAALTMKNAGWPAEVKLERDGATGKIQPVIVPKAVPPDAGHTGWLYNLLNTVRPDGSIAPDFRPPPPAPVAPAPAAAAGGDPAVAAATPPTPATAAAPAAPAPAPLVQLQPTIGTGPGKPVIDEYTQNPLVKSMDLAQSGYSSMVTNMPFDNAASDLAIFIGAAKVLDPPSVVREQEGKNVSRTASPMDQFYGMLNRVQGGSGLTRETRAQIWNMVNEKLKRDIDNVKPIHEQARVQLTQRNLRPEDYLPPLATVQEIDMAKINSLAMNATDPSKPNVVPSTIDPYGSSRTTTPPAARQQPSQRAPQRPNY